MKKNNRNLKRNIIDAMVMLSIDDFRVETVDYIEGLMASHIISIEECDDAISGLEKIAEDSMNNPCYLALSKSIRG